MRLLPACLLVSLLGITAPAEAAKLQELRWDWKQGEERRIHVETTVALPQLVRVELPGGLGVRVTIFQLEYVARCSVEAEREAEWALRCPIEAVRLAAQPIREELDRADRIKEILDNYAARLDQAWLQVEIGRDGRLRHFDLEGVTERMLGDRQETELLRRLFRQGFAGLELNTPTRDLRGDGWTSWSPRLIEHLTADGTLGAVRVENRITRDEGDRLWIESNGEGTIRPAENRTYHLELVSIGIFDTEDGALAERRWAGSATPTPSHVYGWGDSIRPYMFWGQARVAPLDTPVQLAPNGALGDVQVPPELQAKLDDGGRDGVLAPPGRDRPAGESFPYFRLGAVTDLAGPSGATGMAGDVGAGMRLASDAWTGLGARLSWPRQASEILDGEPWRHHDHDAFFTLGWAPDYPVAPRFGLLAGAGLRTWKEGGSEATLGWEVAPLAGVELGMRARIGHGIWLDGWARSTLDIARYRSIIESWDAGGGAEGLSGRAGLSLVLGPDTSTR